MSPERNEFHVNGRVFAEVRARQPIGFARVEFFINDEQVPENRWYAAIAAARRAEKEAAR